MKEAKGIECPKYILMKNRCKRSGTHFPGGVKFLEINKNPANVSNPDSPLHIRGSML
jgi:hypothetical protein